MTDPQPESFFSFSSTIRRLRQKGLFFVIPLVIVVGYVTSTGISLVHEQQQQAELDEIFGNREEIEQGAFPVIEPTLRWGFALDTFSVSEKSIPRNATLQSLLSQAKIPGDIARRLSNEASRIFVKGDLKAGKPFFILKQPSDSTTLMVYEPSPYRYYLFTLSPEQEKVELINRDVTTVTRTVAGTVKGSLWQTIKGMGLSQKVFGNMQESLKHAVDFSRVGQGDQFKLVYDEDFIEGKPVGISKIKAAYYYNSRKKEEAFSFYNDDTKNPGYFSEDGKPWKMGFLKSPLKYSVITSRYSLARLHPVDNVVRPHFGTDFAAPHGTPIMSVADGVILEAARSGGNGNYVKVKHNNTYSTQYLHMSKFAKGIRPGTRVKQGDIIGYVGSTGLATGPHVCFRLWKGTKQVDPFKEKLPRMDVLSTSELAEFKTRVAALKVQLLAAPEQSTPINTPLP
jgi:murein DD-endopeptidase MepM/ murein hydrolase activator NlpD